jgi:hypothetical protein
MLTGEKGDIRMVASAIFPLPRGLCLLAPRYYLGFSPLLEQTKPAEALVWCLDAFAKPLMSF